MNELKLHYFDDEEADPEDFLLKMCIYQGYVPKTCLLSGAMVMQATKMDGDACKGCNGPREKCHGRIKG